MDNIRLAVLEDTPFILDMLEEFILQSNFKDMEIDPSKIYDFVTKAIQSRDKFVIVVAVTDDNTPIGFVSGFVDEHIFSSDKVAFELVWYVKKEYRKSTIGITLINSFEFWAEKAGCKYIQFGSAQGMRETPFVEKLYGRKGYTPIERNFLKRIK